MHQLRIKLACLWIGGLIVVSVGAPLISKTMKINPQDQSLAERLQGPTWGKHWLGTDELGRDILIRLIHGARVSLGVGFMVAITTTILGFIVGGCAGFLGGRWDQFLMRVTDSLLAIPTLPVLIVISAIEISIENQSFLKLVGALCLFSWMSAARLVRSCTLVIKQQEFMLAAEALGASQTRILLRHLLPSVSSVLIIATTFNLGRAVLAEASLSFLGLGIQVPTPSWGNMLSNAHERLEQVPILAIAPGLLILSTVLCFNLLGDQLNRGRNYES